MVWKLYNYDSLNILKHSHVLLNLNHVFQRVPVYANANQRTSQYTIYFFNTLYFSKYVYITIIEEHSMSARQMHRIALENSAIVEMLTCLNLAHIT